MAFSLTGLESFKANNAVKMTTIKNETLQMYRLEPYICTIKGGSRRAEKSREVLMMMKTAKLGWAGSGAGQEQTMSRPGAGWSKLGAGQEQCKSREEARVGQEHKMSTYQISSKLY